MITFYMFSYLFRLYFCDLCGLAPSFYDIFNPSKCKLMRIKLNHINFSISVIFLIASKQFQKQITQMISFARFEFNELKNFHKIQDENVRNFNRLNHVSGCLFVNLN